MKKKWLKGKCDRGICNEGSKKVELKKKNQIIFISEQLRKT